MNKSRKVKLLGLFQGSSGLEVQHFNRDSACDIPRQQRRGVINRISALVLHIVYAGKRQRARLTSRRSTVNSCWGPLPVHCSPARGSLACPPAPLLARKALRMLHRFQDWDAARVSGLEDVRQAGRDEGRSLFVWWKTQGG